MTPEERADYEKVRKPQHVIDAENEDITNPLGYFDKIKSGL